MRFSSNILRGGTPRGSSLHGTVAAFFGGAKPRLELRWGARNLPILSIEDGGLPPKPSRDDIRETLLALPRRSRTCVSRSNCISKKLPPHIQPHVDTLVALRQYVTFYGSRNRQPFEGQVYAFGCADRKELQNREKTLSVLERVSVWK